MSPSASLRPMLIAEYFQVKSSLTIPCRVGRPWIFHLALLIHFRRLKALFITLTRTPSLFLDSHRQFDISLHHAAPDQSYFFYLLPTSDTKGSPLRGFDQPFTISLPGLYLLLTFISSTGFTAISIFLIFPWFILSPVHFLL